MKQNVPGMVSIIVPVYNTKSYLRRCVDSLLRQTYNNIEVILVDDGSTDGSAELCDNLKSEINIIKVIHKKNAGQGLARNDGIEQADGEYIAFVDSDDYVEIDTYKTCIEQIEENKADLCVFGYLKQDKKGREIMRANVCRNIYLGEDVGRRFALHFFGDYESDNDLRGVSSCMSVFRADIIETNNIKFKSEREVLSEDSIFNLDYCKHITKVVTLSDTFYHYCLKRDSFTKRYQENRMDLTITFCDILSQYACKYGLESETENRIRNVLWISIMDCIKQEAVRYGLIDIKKAVNNICNLVKREEVQNVVCNMKSGELGTKQRILLKAVKNQEAFIVYMIGYIKVKTEKI